jgi:hypothetical protein
VAGCFAPDFEHFIRLRAGAGFAHTLPGVFFLDLPLAILVLWLFHRYAKEPLWNALPENVRCKIALGPNTFSLAPPTRFFLIIVSILLGIATHMLWDSFTHKTYWPYHHVPLLRETFTLPILGHRPLYQILQDASSMLGLVIIWIWWHFRSRSNQPIRPRQPDFSPTSDRTALLTASAIALIAAVCNALSYPGLHKPGETLTRAIITWTTVAWIELILYGIIRDRLKRRASVLFW